MASVLSAVVLTVFFTALAAHADADIQKISAKEKKLAQEIGGRITRVPEFQFIRQEAEKLGVKVYLFGGTAAAYSHYVRQDLAREAGDKRYPEMLYDYDYTNIFRSTQDLDVVVDGSAEKATTLEVALRTKFPHFIGDKGANWEVRPLREARGEKEAILNNPDFMKQHTDSHSTGMVEITKPLKGEMVIQDVRDWESKTPQFLKDVQSKKLHYYFSPEHASTSRARKGLNPPILSVIRYLTKAFQYDLEISPEDKKLIKAVIRNFNPKSMRDRGYLERWIEKNGKKLFEHAVDIERAWDTIEELGLRKKLIAIQNNPNTQDSLSWLMSKEPLRSKVIGEGDGKTAAQIAKQLGKDKLIVAHETRSFLAYESITRSKAGDLNAFISRKNTPGELALAGNGFYTRIGRQGARNTGMTIRMELDPAAREGTDFQRKGDIIILKNRNAVRVIPEQIELSVPEYFKMLAEGQEFSNDDRALLEAFRRKTSRTGLQNPDELKEIHKIVLNALNSDAKLPEALLQEWFALPISQDHPEIIEAMLKKGEGGEKWVKKFIDTTGDEWLLSHTHAMPFWKKHPEWLETILQRSTADLGIVTNFLNDDYWLEKHPEWVDLMIRRGNPQTPFASIASTVLANPISRTHPEWVTAFMARHSSLLPQALSKPHWQDMPEFVDELFEIGQPTTHEQAMVDKDIAKYILSQPYSAKHPKWLKSVADRGLADEAIIEYALNQPHWNGQSELALKMLNKFIKSGQLDMVDKFAEHILSKPHWSHLVNTELVELLLSSHYRWAVPRYILSQPAYALKHPEWVELVLKNKDLHQPFVKYVLNQPFATKHPEWVQKIAQSNGYYLVKDALIHSHWASQPELLLDVMKEELLRQRSSKQEQSMWRLVSIKEWETLLQLPHWRDDPILLDATGGNLTVENLRTAVLNGYKSKKVSLSATTCASQFKNLH